MEVIWGNPRCSGGLWAFSPFVLQALCFSSWNLHYQEWQQDKHVHKSAEPDYRSASQHRTITQTAHLFLAWLSHIHMTPAEQSNTSLHPSEYNPSRWMRRLLTKCHEEHHCLLGLFFFLLCLQRGHEGQLPCRILRHDVRIGNVVPQHCQSYMCYTNQYSTYTDLLDPNFIF